MKPEPSAGSLETEGVRRRRFWSSAEKRRMIAETLEPDASVSKIAQRHGVNANLLLTWRRAEAKRTLGCEEAAVSLVPMMVTAAEAQPAVPSRRRKQLDGWRSCWLGESG
jgi:transposase